MIDILTSIGAPGYLIIGAIALGMVANIKLQSLDDEVEENAIDHLELVFELVENKIIPKDYMTGLIQRKRQAKPKGVTGKVIETLIS